MPLSRSQIKTYALAAGFSHPDLITEIAWAESGGNAGIVNSIGAVGLMQILQPVHVKDHPSWTVAYLKNPFANMRAAKVLWDADKRAGGDGTRPWADSKSKGNGGGWGKSAAYARFKGGQTTVDQADIDWGDPLDIWPDEDSSGGILGSGVPEVGESLQGISDMAKLAVKFSEWASNPKSWVNVVYVVAGTAVVVTALSATVRNQVIGQAGKIIGKVGKK